MRFENVDVPLDVGTLDFPCELFCKCVQPRPVWWRVRGWGGREPDKGARKMKGGCLLLNLVGQLVSGSARACPWYDPRVNFARLLSLPLLLKWVFEAGICRRTCALQAGLQDSK